MQCLFGVYIVYFQLFICLKCCFAKSSNFGQIRIKRALLYQLSYELVQGRCFKTNTGPNLPFLPGCQRAEIGIAAPDASVLKLSPLPGRNLHFETGNWDGGTIVIISPDTLVSR